MSSAPPTTLTGPQVRLSFQLAPVKLVETEVNLPPPGAFTGNENDPKPKPKTRFLTSARSEDTPLLWNDQPGSKGRGQGIKAFALALVRLKYLLQINGTLDDSDVLLAGGNGSPAKTFASTIDYRKSDPLTWLGEFCGFPNLEGTPMKCSLAPWFKVGNRTKNQAGASLRVRCGTSKISAANLQIVIHDPAGALREATNDELLVIARALAEPPEWRVRDSLTFPPAPRPVVVPLPPPEPSADPRLPDDALLARFRPWLTSVVRDCSGLVTRGLELEDNLQPLRLAHVYASLESETPRPARDKKSGSRPSADSAAKPDAPAELLGRGGDDATKLTALEVLLDPDQNRVVLVGEPGSGKSTFLQYVTLFLADQLAVADPAQSQFAGLADHVDPLLRAQTALPLRIILREFAPTLYEPERPGEPPPPAGTHRRVREGTARDVLRYLATRLSDVCKEDAAPHLHEVLDRGLALVLFDGLDEIPAHLLGAVRQAIESFANVAFLKCRVAVTCRIASYEKKEFKLVGFPREHTIAQLSSALCSRFVRAWYHELAVANPNYQGDATATAESLLRALDTERLREMAGNPFFLTAMAALHQPDRPLPDTGAKLMDLLVRAVLEESRKRRADAQSPGDTSEVAHLLEKIPSGFTLLRKRLQSIAFTAREQRQGRDGRLISEDLLKHRLVLAKELPAGWVDDLVDALRHRAGLLQSKDGIEFEFAYRFEEFLAGCHLADDDAWPKTAFFERCRDLFRKQGDYARLPVLWAAGFKVHVRESQSPVRDLVSVLVPANPVTTAASLADLELAADIARDARMAAWLDDDVPDTSAVVTRLRSQLEKVRDGTQPIATRARAASAIGRFGDERDGVGLDATRKFPQFAWIKLSKGPFIMGSKAGVGDDDERPQMPKCSLIQQDYSISRYPVTVAQYAAFVDDDGYAAKHEACWTKAGWQWRTKNKITGPHNQTDSVFQTPNHPRVGVSWYEAFAFCRWLTGKLRTAGLIENDEAICLPTEAQWERAARHTDGRTYPWGNEDKAIAEFCNTGNTGLNKTSAVGLFPHGRAKCEAEDMAGNVWEWCLTPWLSDYAGYEAKVGALEAEPEKITTGVLRGGSWGLHDPRDLRCSFRAHFASDLRSNGVGFRCVWVGVGGAR